MEWLVQIIDKLADSPPLIVGLIVLALIAGGVVFISWMILKNNKITSAIADRMTDSVAHEKLDALGESVESIKNKVDTLTENNADLRSDLDAITEVACGNAIFCPSRVEIDLTKTGSR